MQKMFKNWNLKSVSIKKKKKLKKIGILLGMINLVLWQKQQIYLEERKAKSENTYRL